VVNQPAKVRSLIGWMPDHFGNYSHTTVLEYLDFYARALGYSGKDRQVRIQEVMEFADLLPLADRFSNKLSKGMTQRLGLGRALLHDPDILYRVNLIGSPEQLADWAAVNPHVEFIETLKQGGRIEIESSDPEKFAYVLARMVQDGLKVTDFHREERNLEDAFIDLLESTNEAPILSNATPPQLPINS